MKAKNLLILLVLVVVIGAVSVWMMKREEGGATGPVDGTVSGKLFADLPVREVAAVSIVGSEDRVDVIRRDDRWLVNNHHNYPADFGKLSRLLRDALDMKATVNVPTTAEDLAKMELAAPDADEGAGILVQFKDDGGKVLASFVAGEQHSSSQPAPGMPPGMGGYPNGRYLRLPERDNAVVLVDQTLFSLRPDAANWLDKSFVKLEGTVSRAVARQGDELLWELRREDPGADLTLADELPAGKELDKEKADAVDRALKYPNFSKIGDPATEDWGFDRQFTASSFDGFSYTLDIGAATDTGEVPLRVHIAYEPPPAPELPEDESAREEVRKQHEEKLEQARARLAREKARYEGWVYLVSSYTVDNLILDRDDLLKDRDKADEDAGDNGDDSLPPPEEEPVDETEVPDTLE